MKRYAGLGFSLFLALVLAACAQSIGHSGTSSSSEHHSRSDFVTETESRTMTLDVRSAMTSVRLDVEITLSGGSAIFRLTDPSGEVCWEEEITGPDRYKEIHKFAPVVGDWTLYLALEDATGGYDLRWSATN
jgi:hypothetical protein